MQSMKQQEVFKAMADPTRRAILKRLQGGSLSAGEIGAAFDITPASVSHTPWAASEPSMFAINWSWRMSMPSGARVLPDENCT